MAFTRPALLCQVTIDASNKWLDIYETGSGHTHAFSIAEGRYLDINWIVAALDTALDSEGYTADLVWQGFAFGYKVRIQNDARLEFEIRWSSGAHAGLNLGGVLGFDVGSNDTGKRGYVADNLSPHNFYATQGLKSDTYNRKQLLGGETFTAESSHSQRCVWGAVQAHREIELQGIPQALMFSADPNAVTNSAFDQWWEEAARGTPFMLVQDQENYAYDGVYCLECKANESLEEVTRHSPGNALYSVKLKMRRQQGPGGY